MLDMPRPGGSSSGNLSESKRDSVLCRTESSSAMPWRKTSKAAVIRALLRGANRIGVDG